VRRKYIRGAEETRNMHKVLFEESSFARPPSSIRSEGGDIVKTNRNALKLEMVLSSLKWFGGISFSAEKGTFLTEAMSCTRQLIIIN
jgi:hypothetical protein